MRTTRPSRQSIPPRFTFAGFRFPPDVIVLAVRWDLRPRRGSTAGRRCGDLSLDAVEAYVDLTEGQGPIYDAGFVESHVAVRWERDDQDQDLVVLGRLGVRSSTSAA